MTKNFAEFGTVTAEFGGFVAMGMSMAGESEKAAKLMQKVAMLQMAIMIAEKAAAFGKGVAGAGSGAGFGSKLMGGIKGMMGFRYGGMLRGGRYGASTGGVFDGPESGYNVKMHGNEAVVPLSLIHISEPTRPY